MAINPFSASAEDFSDEFTSIIVMKNAKKVFDPLKRDLESDDPTAFNEALSGAVATLQMGISMVAIQYVTNTLMPNLAVRGLAIYSFILSGRVAQGIKKGFLKSKLSRLKSGKAVRSVLSILTDGQKERVEKAKIANDMVSHLDTMRVQKEKIANDTRLSMDSTFTNANATYSNKSLALYTEKTKTGTWQNTTQDRKIYERATGEPLRAGVTWSQLYKKLNDYSEFAKNAEDKIISLAQVQLDTFAGLGQVKVN